MLCAPREEQEPGQGSGVGKDRQGCSSLGVPAGRGHGEGFGFQVTLGQFQPLGDPTDSVRCPWVNSSPLRQILFSTRWIPFQREL